jgi:hypothetical protein
MKVSQARHGIVKVPRLYMNRPSFESNVTRGELIRYQHDLQLIGET